jgi:hypothetical protein
VSADPLAPARSQAEWEAQGWAAEADPIVAASQLEATFVIRFDAESAALLRRAARLTGRTRTEFIRAATLQAARSSIEEHPLSAAG